MAEFIFGQFIRQKRKQLGITQEKLANPFMDRSHISRIEKGQVVPGKRTLEMLFERLGYNPGFIMDFLIDEDAAKYQSMMDELESHLKRKRLKDAGDLIALLEDDKVFMGNPLYRQFLLTSKASITIDKGENGNKARGMLMEAIEISIPVFNEEDLEQYLLTKEDIRIINMMASLYHDAGNLGKAINLMYQLKDNFDKRYMDKVSKGAHYPMVIYNLTKYLGMAGRFEEAIKLCDVGKNICLELSSFRLLPGIIVNKACCLHDIGDKETCERLLRQVYHASDMFEQFSNKEIIKNYARTKLGIVF